MKPHICERKIKPLLSFLVQNTIYISGKTRKTFFRPKPPVHRVSAVESFVCASGLLPRLKLVCQPCPKCVPLCSWRTCSRNN